MGFNFLDWLLPQHCYLCAKPSPSAVCPACIDALPYQKVACPRCGRATRHPKLCTHCRYEPPLFRRSYAVLRYLAPVDELIHAAKYQHDFRILILLADLMQQYFQQHPPSQLPEVLIPVPLHPLRQWERGYNQSHLLAKKLAQHFNLPLDYRSCCRVKNTEQQARLRSRAERHANVYEAFAYFPPHPAWQHVALVDDVFSTGSTLNEMTRVLLAGGVKRVDIWCCARR